MKLNRQKKRIYMDLCSLERPYDDQSYPRIEAETAAVTLDLLKKCRGNKVKIWYGTPVDFAKKEGLL